MRLPDGYHSPNPYQYACCGDCNGGLPTNAHATLDRAGGPKASWPPPRERKSSSKQVGFRGGDGRNVATAARCVRRPDRHAWPPIGLGRAFHYLRLQAHPLLLASACVPLGTPLPTPAAQPVASKTARYYKIRPCCFWDYLTHDSAVAVRCYWHRPQPTEYFRRRWCRCKVHVPWIFDVLGDQGQRTPPVKLIRCG
jgi:hypothetical protein